MALQSWAYVPAEPAPTVVDAVRAALARIDATEPDLHALLHVDAAGALATAGWHDRQHQRGASPGPLSGMTVVVKDNVSVRGMPLTCGSRALPEGPAARDASLVRRIRAAGGVVVAKSNLDEFGMGATTERSAFGPTHNPHDLRRTPGGSSGGSAAAVAAGQVPLAVGTDTGGSIREPASLCGVVGVKPSDGSVPRRGVVPFAPALEQAGPLAATVADAALLHEVMSGLHGLAEAGLARDVDLAGHRIGVVTEMSGAANAPGVRGRFEHAVAALAGLGAEVVEVRLPSAPDALSAYYSVSSYQCVTSLAPYAHRMPLGPEAERRYLTGLELAADPRRLVPARRIVRALRREVAAAFAGCTILASPTMPATAPLLGRGSDYPLDTPYTDCWTVVANLTGIPALSLPAGRSAADGLPVGVQLMAPHGLDARLYRVAAALETARRG